MRHFDHDDHLPSYAAFRQTRADTWLPDIVLPPWRRKGKVSDMTKGQRILALMGLPAEASPAKLKVKPYVNYILMALTFFVSITAFYRPEVGASLAFFPGAANRFWGLNFITLFFVHGGWMHLLSNMYFLFVFGDNVEDRVGHWRYFLLVMGSTISATFLSFALAGQNNIPHVGASGGIFGVMIYYMLAFPRAQFTYNLLLVFFFRISASLLLLLFVVPQLTGAVEQMLAGGKPGIDFLAHVGGALGGLAFFFAYEANERRALSRRFLRNIAGN